MALDQLPGFLSLMAIYLVYGTTFSLAGGSKVKDGTVPDWFRNQFSQTFLAKFPGLSIAYWTIALLECSVPVFLILSVVNPVFLGIAVGIAGIVFGILGFGLRLVNDFQGAANSFFYFAATLVTQLYLLKQI